LIAGVAHNDTGLVNANKEIIRANLVMMGGQVVKSLAGQPQKKSFERGIHMNAVVGDGLLSPADLHPFIHITV
jgi:hypothetical protein